MTPLRQFQGIPAEVVRKAEEKQFVSDDLVRIKYYHLMSLASTALVPLL